MVQAVKSPGTKKAGDAVREDYMKAYHFMLVARLSDEKYASLYRGGKIQGGVFLGRGQEALSAATGISLRKGDIFAPLIRDQAGRLAFGESLLDATRTFLGSSLGPMRGRDGNVHRGRPRDGYFAMISHLGAMVPTVAGALMARRFRGITDIVGVASLGDGATSTGAFHEGLNLAAVEKLPLVLVVANNQYAYSTPNSRQFACHDLLDKAVGYGVDGHSIDGTDLLACLGVLKQAIARAREGHGPQMIVASLLRLCGHGEHDDAAYIDPELKHSKLGRDCLKVAEDYMLEQEWADEKQFAQWRKDAVAKVEESVATAQREAVPDPGKEDWCAISSRHLVEQQSE